MAAAEDELAAAVDAEKTQTIHSFTRKRPLRQPWPDDIERYHIVAILLTAVPVVADRGCRN